MRRDGLRVPPRIAVRRSPTKAQPSTVAPTNAAPNAFAAGLSRADSWKNTVTGLGTSIDPLAKATFSASRMSLQNPQTLENLYYEDDLCRKIVDKIVDAAMRQGWGIELRSSDDSVDAADAKRRAEVIMRRARELRVDTNVQQACKMGRLQGGASVFVGADGGGPDTPLNPRAPGKIQFITVLERIELMPSAWSSEFGSRHFGRPVIWSFTPQGVASATLAPRIHTSRLLKFEGIEPSKRERLTQSGWGLSVLVPVIEVIRDAQQNWRSVSLILAQAHQAVFKMKNLIEMVGNNDPTLLQRRMEIVNLARSISRAVLVDADAEDFEYHSAALSGLDTIMDKTWQRLAAAADMPATVLMGISPAGMNATGASDIQQWYDSVQAYRTSAIEPELEYLVRIIAAEQGDPSPGDWCVTWPSLWQMSPTEEATYRKTIADTDAVYIDKGVVEPEEVTVSRFGSGGWSPETYVDLKIRKATSAPTRPEDEATAYPASGQGSNGPGETQA